MAEAAVWMAREQRCCPFLTLSLRFQPSSDQFWIEAIGTRAGKEFVRESIVAEIATRLAPGT